MAEDFWEKMIINARKNVPLQHVPYFDVQNTDERHSFVKHFPMSFPFVFIGYFYAKNDILLFYPNYTNSSYTAPISHLLEIFYIRYSLFS